MKVWVYSWKSDNPDLGGVISVFATREEASKALNDPTTRWTDLQKSKTRTHDKYETSETITIESLDIHHYQIEEFEVK